MNLKILGVTALSAFMLFGCNTDNNNKEEAGMNNSYENQNNDYSPEDDGFNNVNYDRPNGGLDGQDYNEENIGNEDTYRDNNRNEYTVARKIADQVSDKVEDVDRAYVLKTENNAYVAVTLDNGENRLNDPLKKEVAKVVKKTDNDVDNVYVSANEKFFDMTNDYAQDVRNGKPVEGFFEEFGQMINRIFPEAK
ncbi:YhcN/YlaJ family sporulation lipoprotein [Pontibacillus litoralis]|uniref:YhcN/YlaJ family sporulation lipoprotein n=1 Tax=Pontibacillus litoralis JSM 072002 TaxID=1385512 RepID=A0A0A5G8B2_9BACI|nr:YhcN/YlaJ family sporulation lipoprotein [Pontibacillus litoralis]KGX87355.1 hypothetical protein N784_15755 [Pontibacillus litoralis JSM 072002]